MVQSQITFVNHKLDSMEGYDLEDLLRSKAVLLGKGTFGFSYKAELENGKTVAVKRLKDCCLREEEFNQKIQELAKLSDHQSLLPLRAYYYSKDEKLLIFDYMPTSSLASLLHGKLLLPVVSIAFLILLSSCCYCLLSWLLHYHYCFSLLLCICFP